MKLSRLGLALTSSALALTSLGCGLEEAEVRTPPMRPNKVGRLVRLYEDSERPKWSAKGQRPLTTVIWYPTVETAAEEEWLIGPPNRPVFFAGWASPNASLVADEELLPLVLLSHGTGGAAPQLAWLAEHLASHGFIVACVNHHGNTAAEDELMPQGFALFWERATDLSRVLDRLLEDVLFGARIDRSRIAALGYSLGGHTVLSVVGARTSLEAFDSFCASHAADVSCQAPPEFPEALDRFDELREADPIVQSSLARHGESFLDRRIRAVYAIAPAVGMAFTEESLCSVAVPVKILVADADAIVPPDTNGLRIAALIDGCELEIIGEVGHHAFLAECTERGKKYLPICRDGEGIVRTAIHQQVAEDVLDFLNRALGSV